MWSTEFRQEKRETWRTKMDKCVPLSCFLLLDYISQQAVLWVLRLIGLLYPRTKQSGSNRHAMIHLPFPANLLDDLNFLRTKLGIARWTIRLISSSSFLHLENAWTFASLTWWLSLTKPDKLWALPTAIVNQCSNRTNIFILAENPTLPSLAALWLHSVAVRDLLTLPLDFFPPKHSGRIGKLHLRCPGSTNSPRASNILPLHGRPLLQASGVALTMIPIYFVSNENKLYCNFLKQRDPGAYIREA